MQFDRRPKKKSSFPLHSIEFFIYSQTCVYAVVYGLHLFLNKWYGQLVYGALT